LAASQPNPVALGIEPGDVLVMRIRPTSITANSFTDANFVNSFATGGLNTDEEIGRIARIIAGQGRGQARKISDNTSTQITLESDWTENPDADSIIIIEEPSWREVIEGTPIDNQRADTPTTVEVPMENLEDKVLLILPVGVDGGGAESFETISQVREIFIFGDPGEIGGVDAAPNVTNFVGSEDPYIQTDGTVMSEVTFSFDRPSPLGTFAGVDIYMAPLDTDAVDGSGVQTEEPKFITSVEDNASPDDRKFITNQLPQSAGVSGAARLWAVSYNTTGNRNAISGSPNDDVLLDGKDSAPSPVQNVWCQQIADGLRVSWDEGAESDLAGYEVADTGDVTPSADGDVTDAHVIAVVQPNHGSSNRAVYDFREKLYTGNSDTTVITLSAAAGAKFFPSGAHVVGGVGKNVQMWNSADAESNEQVVSNTEKTITFAAASIPTGELRFYVRGSNGRHTFYIRAVDSSGNKSTWKPVPPTVQWCFPRAIDDTKDIALPKVWNDGTDTSISSHYHVHPLYEEAGGVWLHAAAQTTANDTESDVDLALKQNINGITTWEVEIEHSDDGGSPYTTTYVKFPANTSRENYQYLGDPIFKWHLVNDLGFYPLENQGINQIRFRARNSYGWGAWVTGTGKGVGLAAPHFTGQKTSEPTVVETPSASIIYPNLAQSKQFRVDLSSADLTINPPEYRDGAIAKGSGAAVIGKEIFYVTIVQPSSPGPTRKVSWHANYKGVGDGRKPAAMLFDSWTTWVFRTESSTFFRCIGYDINAPESA